MMPNLFTYLDYRHYLGDLFDALHEKDPDFSFRSFSRMAGSTSPNFLQLIRDRKLNIQPDSVGAIARAFKLSRKEESYFETIVAFDHAKTHEEKDRYFQRILSTRDYGPVKQLEKDQYDYFSHWYMPVVRELITAKSYSGDPAWIALRIVPEVSIAKVAKAITLLESLKLIRRDEHDQYFQTDTSISTPSQVLSIAVTNYHRDVITLARESIERFSAEQRDIRSVTLGITKEGVAEVKKRIEGFWKELLAYANTQTDPQQVVQVNMQVFPLSLTDDEVKQ